MICVSAMHCFPYSLLCCLRSSFVSTISNKQEGRSDRTTRAAWRSFDALIELSDDRKSATDISDALPPEAAFGTWRTTGRSSAPICSSHLSPPGLAYSSTEFVFMSACALEGSRAMAVEKIGGSAQRRQHIACNVETI